MKKKSKMKNFDLEKFKDYVDTYDQQTGHKNYEVKTIIDDFLYGIGICLDGEEYKNGDGYKRFKAVLLEHLGVKCHCGNPVDTTNPDCIDFSLCDEHAPDA